MPEATGQISTVTEPLEVTIKYRGIEKRITGPPNQVAASVLDFLRETIPQLELASRLILSVDMQQLAEACEGVLAFTPEGVVITVPVEKLADRELILLHLARMRIAQAFGKADDDSVQSANLIEATKRTPGTVAGRLSELCVEGLAERKGKGMYRATTLGLKICLEQILPKLKSKT